MRVPSAPWRNPSRGPAGNPTRQQKKLESTRILSVTVKGNRGVLGATVWLIADDGQAVARRTIGTAVLTGCRGPDSTNIAVRESGTYSLRVRYSDGHAERREVDLGAAAPKRVELVVDRKPS